MTMSESVRSPSGRIYSEEEMAAYREVAEKFVENIISRAVEEVSDQLAESNKDSRKYRLKKQFTLHNPPEIQIDLIGPRSPSPEEEPLRMPWEVQDNEGDFGDEGDNNRASNRARKKGKSSQPKSTVETQQNAVGDVSMDELKEFALVYVKDIIGKATELAAERAEARASLNKENSALAEEPEVVAEAATSQTQGPGRAPTKSRGSQPWYLRFRQVIRRLMRSACLCKAEHPDTEPNS